MVSRQGDSRDARCSADPARSINCCSLGQLRGSFTGVTKRQLETPQSGDVSAK